MKQTIAILFLFINSVVYAQSLENHLTGGEDLVAQNAIKNFIATPEIQGFRVCIFNGSEQDARNLSRQALELCYSTFPDIKGEIMYDAPIFKVLVGACLNRIEAIMLQSRLKETFPKSFIMSCSISINDFINSDSRQVADSTMMTNNEN